MLCWSLLGSHCFFEFPPATPPIGFLFWNFRHRLVRYYWDKIRLDRYTRNHHILTGRTMGACDISRYLYIKWCLGSFHPGLTHQPPVGTWPKHLCGIMRGCPKPRTYPSGYVKIAIENGHRNSGSSHRKWWFSIVMLVITRGYPSEVVNLSSEGCWQSIGQIYTMDFSTCSFGHENHWGKALVLW